MPAFTDNTKVGTGSTTSPGAGAVLASISAPAAGTYDVTVMAMLTGTAETALRNLRLRENTTTVADALPSLSSAGDWTTIEFPRVEVNEGGGNLDVIAIAAGVVGAIYNIVLLATRVG